MNEELSYYLKDFLDIMERWDGMMVQNSECLSYETEMKDSWVCLYFFPPLLKSLWNGLYQTDFYIPKVMMFC